MQLLVDLANGVTHGVSLRPANTAANTNGVGIDFQNADVRTHMIVAYGAITNTGFFTVKAQESDDNTTFTDVADTNANTGNTNSVNTETIKSFLRTKRYMRAVAILGTAGDAAIISATILSQKKYEGSNNAGYTISPQS